LNRDYEILTLAALLHDVGKFVERAGETNMESHPPALTNFIHTHGSQENFYQSFSAGAKKKTQMELT